MIIFALSRSKCFFETGNCQSQCHVTVSNIRWLRTHKNLSSRPGHENLMPYGVLMCEPRQKRTRKCMMFFVTRIGRIVTWMINSSFNFKWGNWERKNIYKRFKFKDWRFGNLINFSNYNWIHQVAASIEVV